MSVFLGKGEERYLRMDIESIRTNCYCALDFYEAVNTFATTCELADLILQHLNKQAFAALQEPAWSTIQLQLYR